VIENKGVKYVKVNLETGNKNVFINNVVSRSIPKSFVNKNNKVVEMIFLLRE